MTFPDGSIKEGKFENNVFVGEQIQSKPRRNLIENISRDISPKNIQNIK